MIPVIIVFLIAGAIVFLMTRPKPRQPVLDRKEFRKFPLIKKSVISHNTAVYRFGLPQTTDTLGLPTGQHISVMAEINGKEVVRSYTPTSMSEDLGYFDLLIKTYPQGNVSKMFSELTLGDKINVRGPKGNFNYTPNLCSYIGMIAGGTGITPMLQIIHAIMKHPEDRTHVSLIFANVNEEDILLRDELEELSAAHPHFNVHYVLNNPPEGWEGEVGFVSEDMIRKYLPGPAKDVKILLCGPPPMVKAMTQHCETVGYDKARPASKLEDMVFKF
ncbi:NADH-cytochrome b5 reductase [Dimargaris cristalligena]|uniref:NADH-cytochrome b5 reductase n=1 Tax=Dimargaris cristalligena TaxID=215637 RepID=A0A4P9ZVT6_9FUNG|nr:NADH-cytochrome b5 reductase [Dimargaris cristalligena]RKP37707.1 NADH-cytochrome b5 reductase 1 [Dimargaris cristalligena]|eukprot:RKP37707.1 NADH-cytochrome b5 reductase 1 [Dimargaris cristalligena]